VIARFRAPTHRTATTGMGAKLAAPHGPEHPVQGSPPDWKEPAAAPRTHVRFAPCLAREQTGSLRPDKAAPVGTAYVRSGSI
jgi:hypothetical protein